MLLMKNLVFYLLFISALLFLSFSTSAQSGSREDPVEPDPLTGICYLYDDAGNRIVRYVCGGPHPRPAPVDATAEAAASSLTLGENQHNSAQAVQVRVYPNPANDFLQVVQQGFSPDATVLVYSPDGREVLSQSLGDGQIAIGHLAAATYFLVIQGNGVKYTASFVKLE
jgi:hypothetical protein